MQGSHVYNSLTVHRHKTAAVTGRPLVVPVVKQLRTILEDARRRTRGEYIIAYRGGAVKSIRGRSQPRGRPGGPRLRTEGWADLPHGPPHCRDAPGRTAGRLRGHARRADGPRAYRDDARLHAHPPDDADRPARAAVRGPPDRRPGRGAANAGRRRRDGELRRPDG